MLRRIKFWIQEILYHLRQQFLSYFILGLSCLSYFILCDFLFLSAYTGYYHYLNWQKNLVLEIFVDDNPDTEKIDSLMAFLRHHPVVDQARYVTPAEAAEQIEQQLGLRMADVLSVNPLPASVRIKLKSDLADSRHLDSFLTHLYHYPGLQQDFQDFTLYSRWYSTLHSLAVIIILIFGCLVITFFLSMAALTYHIQQKNRITIRLLLQMGFRRFDLYGPFILENILITQITSWLVFFLVILINQTMDILIINEWFLVFNLVFSIIFTILPIQISLRSLNQ